MKVTLGWKKSGEAQRRLSRLSCCRSCRRRAGCQRRAGGVTSQPRGKEFDPESTPREAEEKCAREAIIASLEAGVRSVTEYAPRKAKEAIVGNGAASKEQVQLMLEKTLQVKLESRHLDATDALAIALCHFYETSSPLKSAKGKGGWEQFIKDHPERIS